MLKANPAVKAIIDKHEAEDEMWNKKKVKPQESLADRNHNRVIELTKADEATSLGEVLGLAISQRLPVAYLTDGPRIPDDLQVPRSHQLISRAVGLQATQDPSEDTMADMFAGLYQQPARRVS
jgi:hypothetical protein